MSKSSGSGGGCLGFVFAIIAIWALLFGFTCNGVKHQISFTEENGVELVKENKKPVKGTQPSSDTNSR